MARHGCAGIESDPPSRLVDVRLTAADTARCGVLSRPNSSAIRAACVLAPLGPGARQPHATSLSADPPHPGSPDCRGGFRVSRRNRSEPDRCACAPAIQQGDTLEVPSPESKPTPSSGGIVAKPKPTPEPAPMPEAEPETDATATAPPSSVFAIHRCPRRAAHQQPSLSPRPVSSTPPGAPARPRTSMLTTIGNWRWPGGGRL